jgi:hypothetical protein
MGQTYLERELIKPTPYLVSGTIFFLVLFIVVRSKFVRKCPMWIIRCIFILFTICFSGTISLVSVFSYISWMWTFLIVAIIHVPLYLLWLRFLQKKIKKDGSYELGDATETQFLMDPEESYSRKRQTAFHWAQVICSIFEALTIVIKPIIRFWCSSC